MQSTEKAEFCTAILAVGEFFKETPSKGMLDIYWTVMKWYSLSQVQTAIAQHLSDPDRGRFMPKPADLIAKIRGNGYREPLLAWKLVVDAMREQGRYSTVMFSDPFINAVIRDMGGWIWMCDQNIDEPWTQREFERRYDIYQKQGIKSLDALPGLHQLSNEAKGYFDYIPEPALVGDGVRPDLKQISGKASGDDLNAS